MIETRNSIIQLSKNVGDRIPQIALPDGSITTDAKQIGEVAEGYFQTLFQSGEQFSDEDLFVELQPQVTAMENVDFCKIPNAEEVW